MAEPAKPIICRWRSRTRRRRRRWPQHPEHGCRSWQSPAQLISARRKLRCDASVPRSPPLHVRSQLVNDRTRQNMWIKPTGCEPKMIAPSLDVIRRTLDAEASYTLSRLQVLERLPGNPVGIAYRRIEDGPLALIARHLPVPYFNSVFGLDAGHEAHIEPLLAWYREH